MRSIWLLAIIGLATAEDGANAWLRYARLPDGVIEKSTVPANIVTTNSTKTSPVYVAAQELQKGIDGILGKTLNITEESEAGPSILVATLEAYSGNGDTELPALAEDGYWLSTEGGKVEIVGRNERGALYGAFTYLSMLAQANFTEVAYASNPSAAIRWTNEWDNMDGSIERGYAGSSIFFKNNGIVTDTTRVSAYARLLASIGINGIVINNVNANANILSDSNMAGLARIADAMRPWGVKVGISANFAAPQSFGGLRTYDPLDKLVIDWWAKITDKLYSHVPDMAGYLVKASSEGQPGPLTYRRTLADGANLFAKAVKSHGGIVMFRAFVYDSQNLKESNWKDDRANAAVDFFDGLNGKFDDNVVVQIKYGPIDFQVREPASPLFGYLTETASAIELQVTQEYLGQQCHFVYLAPLWKTILNFDLRVDGQQSIIGTDILSGKRFNKTLTGYAAVVNVGQNANWMGSHLAMSNLYAYGKLAWDPTADEVTILQDWTRLTFSSDPAVVDAVTQMSMQSWPAYENYTGNLGIQTLADITGNHYGPNPQSMDNNPWGQWTRADHNGVGMDRTVKNGTGFAGQYPEEIAAIYEDIETTPEDLLLWYHHVPWTHELSTGKTVIQHFYDAHYAGAATAGTFPGLWAPLKDLIDEQRFEEVAFRLDYQAGHAVVWRDAINEFYYATTGIADEAGRVHNHTWRVEAEKMTLANYRAATVNPFEMASDLHMVQASGGGGAASAQTTLAYPAGTYDLVVGYFDVAGGTASWELFLNDASLGTWKGDHESRLGYATTNAANGHSGTRITFRNVSIAEGDVVRITGQPNGAEPAPLDYLAVVPPGVAD
ncbi:glycoside hydrolase family 67 protein [Xylariomycetidae sp. FL0641]|nr:glycoside hydrolase family 67 protein [Xylariomycetidae sp. FL0641]